MSVTLERLPDDIAVLKGVRSRAALSHLGASLTDGTAFERWRGLVIDLDGAAENAVTDERLVQLLDDAVAACLRRRQAIAFVTDDSGTRSGVATIRRTLRLLDTERAARAAAEVARLQASVLAGATTVAFQLTYAAVRSAIDLGRRPWGAGAGARREPSGD
jgi:hypothetical protein